VKQKDCITSIPVTLVPFLQNNDGTRMQMASNQMKQALDIFHSEHPLVETGLERFYLNNSDLCVLCNYNGIVLHIHENYILLKLNELEYGFNEFKIIPTDKYDYTYFVKSGQPVKKGDILGKVKRFNSEKSYKTILNGTNLLTGINCLYGFNYEDSISISESCFEKLSHQERIVETIGFNEKQVPLSLKDGSYEPFLEPGTEVSIGDVLCMIKNSDLTNIGELISPPHIKRSSSNGVIEKVDIYINNYHDSTRELSLYLNQKYNNNIEGLSTILKRICSVYNAYTDENKINEKDLPDYIVNEIQYLTGLTDRSKWKFKNVEINVLVKYTICKKSEYNIGDKLANRHGNKGTTPLIIPDEDMLKINGRPLDVVINTMGIPGRMNLGQLYECYASNIVNKVKNISKKLVKMGKEKEAREVIKDFYNTIDKTDGKYIFKSIDYDKDINHLISGISFVSPPFDSIDVYNLKEALTKYKVDTIYKVYAPWSKTNIKMPVGYMFWEKLHHLSEEKIAARSVGGYNKKTMQPLSGKKLKGGQKFGEMEVWALLAHNAPILLQETLGLKSDDIEAKNKVLQTLLDTGRAKFTKIKSKASETFLVYLQSLGLDFQEDEDITKENKED
jgi:DNA-directed RNA polymerase subunit beta